MKAHTPVEIKNGQGAGGSSYSESDAPKLVGKVDISDKQAIIAVISNAEQKYADCPIEVNTSSLPKK